MHPRSILFMGIHTGKMLRLYFTSDVHGHFFPVDYATGGKRDSGLLSCVKYFSKDGDTLIIDAGDTIQGSPFSMYARQLPTGPRLLAGALNRAGYDYITLGNHDFNYGREYLKDYLQALDAKCLCANVSGDLPLAASSIHTLANGLRVGIVGIVTDHVNVWERPEHLEGLAVGDPFAAAKAALEEIKNQSDVTLCIYHGGFECDFETDEPLTSSTEHIGARLCRELDFDLLLTGHQHRAIEGRLYHGTYIVQPRPNAEHFLYIEGEMRANRMHFTSAFHVPDGSCRPQDTGPLQHTEDEVQRWLDEPVGRLDRPLPLSDRVNMALNGAPMADFSNQMQLKITGAQLSCASIANQLPGFDCEVRLRDIIANYPFNDVLVVLEVTGEVLRLVMERAASYLEIGSNGRPEVASRFLLPKTEHYNYDFFAGITYTADLRRPVGQRVVEIIYQGCAVRPGHKFTLCTTSYRASGTGGYEAYRRCPVIHRGQTEIHDVIRQYIASREETETMRYDAPAFIY
jgi:2',3'-cyclic-nucleotide 2'-phosphodiesterase/3'-nucleotidase